MSESTPLRERVLERGVKLGVPLLRALVPDESKIGRGIAARRRAADRLSVWAAGSRRPDAPLAWFHAPSVGEALMAKAIIAALRERLPALQVAFTHFSPSAERVADAVGADVADYLPWDTRDEVGRAVAALRPDLLACVRTEVWPVLVRATHARGGRVALVNAVLSPGSGRLKPWGRFMVGPTYAALDAVGAVSEGDAALFRRLGVAPERVRVTGDARYDQVARRVRALLAADERRAELRARVGGGDFTLVAGSTWASDEERLVPAIAALDAPARRWVLVPHEPTDEHVRALERRLRAAGLRCRRWSDPDGDAAATVVVVDAVGVLADLYSVADAAYVGGGFHGAGLHSVVEPAALGVPVLFGPRHGNAREAAALAQAGGFEVGDADALRERLAALVADPAARAGAGDAAARFVRARTGAADRSATLLAALLDGSAGGVGSSMST